MAGQGGALAREERAGAVKAEEGEDASVRVWREMAPHLASAVWPLVVTLLQQGSGDPTSAASPARVGGNEHAGLGMGVIHHCVLCVVDVANDRCISMLSRVDLRLESNTFEGA